MINYKLSLFFLASCFLVSSSHQKEVCIAPDGSSSSSSSKSCKTIDQFCRDNANQLSDNTVVTVLNGTHSLNTPCEFKNINGLTLRGLMPTIIECSDSVSAGLLFLNVVTLEVYDIEFIGCGASWTAKEPEFMDDLKYSILSALLLVNGSDHALKNIIISGAKSAGMYIYNVTGNVTVDSCKINNASSILLDHMSGNVIVYDHSATKPTNLRITNSQFANSGYENISYYHGKCSEYDYSSGLSLFLASSKLKIDIDNTTFINNSGCNGGNMAVLIFNHSSVTISADTKFIRGRARYGGGVYVSFENSFWDSLYHNITTFTNSKKVLSIVNCTFAANHAEYSGGGAYMHWKQSLTLNGSYEMEVVDSTFTKNYLGLEGSGGLALHYKTFVDTSDDPNHQPKFHVSLKLSNCTFHHHYPNPHSTELQSESSVIVAAKVPYLGINGINVNSNNCTGILGISSTLVFYNSTTIQNNSALTGAGIRLCSGSTLYFTPYTDLTIMNNSVLQTGGGIQVNSICLVSKPMCFFQYTKVFIDNVSLLDTVNFDISDNHAERGGDNIYGGSIDYCYFLYVTTEHHEHYKDPLHTPNNSISNHSLISSNPQHICFTYKTDYQDEFKCNRTKQIVSIYPGEKITYPIRVVGQSFGSVPGTVLASIIGGAAINDSEYVQTVDIAGQDISYTVYSLQREILNGSEIQIQLKAGLHSDTSVHEYTKRYLPAIISVQFKECPFGFKFVKADPSARKYSCKCMISQKIIRNCSIQNQTITKNATSWLGMFTMDNQTYLASNKYCPLDYCNHSVVEIKSNTYNLSQNDQCQYNRVGTLCGSCPEGWSLVLGSSECRENCSNVWLLLIVPFALAGLLLVAVIHFLNLTVTMGTVCGLIFYANIIQIYSVDLLTTHPVPGLTNILQVFLSWLNLDLGISTCFYDGMEAFGKTMLSFVFPLYIFLISIVIVVLSNKFIFFTRMFGENSLKILATLFLLSFTKMLRVIIGNLQFKLLDIYKDQNCTVSKALWIVDGNISYFDTKHLILFVMALILILLSLPFSVSLLCIRHIFFLSHCKALFQWLSKLKPFFDTYTGPYKDNATFWTGLLLFVRLFLLIVRAVDYISKESAYIIIVSVCFVLAILMVVLQGVFKQHQHNVLEAFFICNIGVIFIAQGRLKTVWIFSHFMVSLAFLVFIGIVGYHIYLKFSGSKFASRATLMRRQVSFDVGSVEGMRGYDKEESTEDENLIEASDRLIHFPPVESIDYNYERSNSFGKRS